MPRRDINPTFDIVHAFVGRMAFRVHPILVHAGQVLLKLRRAVPLATLLSKPINLGNEKFLTSRELRTHSEPELVPVVSVVVRTNEHVTKPVVLRLQFLHSNSQVDEIV